jgi:hypothetical protein
LLRLLLGGLLTLSALAGQGQTPSVLAQGSWLKIGVTGPGLYRLGAAALRQAGLDPRGVDPRTLRLYGSGGGMLPQPNAAPRPADLTENAVLVTGEADGRFDDGDFVLFYSAGPHAVRYDSTAKRFSHQTNLYADTTFYFLTAGTQPGLRVPDRASVAASQTLTAYDDYVFLEKDLRNILASGREWYGESLTFGDLAVTFPLPNLVANSPLLVTLKAMAAAPVPTTAQVKLNGQVVGSQSFGTVTAERYDVKGLDALSTFSTPLTAPPADGVLRFVLSYDRAGQSAAQAYLDYLAVQARRTLSYAGEALRFRSLESRRYPAVSYQLANSPSGARVWDVTQPLRPTNQLFTLDNGTLRFGVNSDTLREFVLFPEKDALEPASLRAIPTQNLHGLKAPALLVVAAPAFRAQAERLAEFRRQHDGLTVAVVTTEQVFNEFSSGKPDPTALRDFARFLYRQPGSPLKYLLLFGAATYDYRGRTGGNLAEGYVPVYESRESLHPIYSYSSDDYFGFLKDTDGEWPETYAGDQTLDLGIGRLPVKTADEATTVVDKLIRYENPASQGAWRQRLSFVADNGDYNLHQQDADRLAGEVLQNRPGLWPEKLFIDAFPLVPSATGNKAPAVNAAINQRMQEGALIVNYTGHGGPSGWAEEQILTRADIFSWRNADRMPLMVTATCEFGRYDNPAEVSGAELALLQPRAGVIGLLTTTRPVFANTNFLVNEAFYLSLLSPKNLNLRLGDVQRLTKNGSLSGPVNRNFALLGDPSMRLALPPPGVVLTSAPDTLRPLRPVTLTGEVRGPDGQRDATFSGPVTVTVLDKPATVRTAGSADSPSMTFDILKNVLFNGTATVRSGRFSVQFVVPRGVEPTPGRGKISLYARRADGSADAGGGSEVWVGGAPFAGPSDTTPPQIALFLNDSTFRDGGEVGPDARLLARLTDASGISLRRDLLLTLDDTVTVRLNEAFVADADNFRAGSLSYALRHLAPGAHVLRLTAYDAFDNQAGATLHFSVSEHTNPTLSNVDSYPNPFREQTTFRFEHDAPGDDLEVEAEILDATGRVLRRLRAAVDRADSPLSVLTWDGRGDSGALLANGLYFYRIFARSFQTGHQQRGAGKLLLAR